MAAVEIKDVKMTRLDSALLWNAMIDAPKAGTKENIFVTHMEGWVLTRGQKPTAIEIFWKDLRLHRSASFVERPDVQEHFRHIDGAVAAGFYADVNLLLFPESFELTVRVCFGEENAEVKETIGVIRGQRQAPPLPFTPTIQPLAVYGLGRSGTTLLMRTLSNHPQMVVYDQYPYEMRMMSYMFHTFGVLSARADHNSSHPDYFLTDFSRIGFNPFHAPALYNDTVINWFNQQYLEEVSAFSMRSTESFYRTLANAQHKAKPKYFAEKVVPYIRNQYQWTLYPQSKALLLVRDLRDLHCSVRSFNQKRGFASFGYEKSDSEEEFINITERIFRFNQANWKQHPKQVKLVRYEDMILQPRETLLMITKFLGLDDSPGVIEQVLKETQKDTPNLKQHRTTDDAAQSIGRWKHDLNPKIAELYKTRFGEEMRELGYEI
jgi:hypothetical protein